MIVDTGAVRAEEVREDRRETLANLMQKYLYEMTRYYPIAMGGDGTLNEVVCGISDPARTTLGLIPAGTGNDFATAAKIPFGLAALGLILRGEPKPTDYLECGGGMRSINIAGMGIDVAILRRCERMRGSAKSKYFRSLLATLCTYRGVHMKIVADGVQTECKALIAAACNGSRFGGGIAICPPAALDDGKLDLVVIECPKRYKIPYDLVKLKGGKVLSLPPARHILCDAVEIVSAEECGTQFDGELRDSDKLSARVVRGGLRMYRG